MNKTLMGKNIVCNLCGKTVQVGNNKPHSLHRTKRMVKPNVQKTHGLLLCTRCLRTLAKKKAL